MSRFRCEIYSSCSSWINDEMRLLSRLWWRWQRFRFKELWEGLLRDVGLRNWRMSIRLFWRNEKSRRLKRRRLVESYLDCWRKMYLERSKLLSNKKHEKKSMLSWKLLDKWLKRKRMMCLLNLKSNESEVQKNTLVDSAKLLLQLDFALVVGRKNYFAKVVFTLFIRKVERIINSKKSFTQINWNSRLMIHWKLHQILRKNHLDLDRNLKLFLTSEKFFLTNNYFKNLKSIWIRITRSQ